MPTKLPIGFLLLVWLAIAAACDGRPGFDIASASEAPPNARVAVGPIPGPPAKHATLANPYVGDSVARQHGRQLFVRYNCSGCHGGRAGGGMGPSLRDQDWIYGRSEAQIFDSIAQGRANGMPAWGTKLPDQQIWELVTYVQSLRTQDEPDPPS